MRWAEFNNQIVNVAHPNKMEEEEEEEEEVVEKADCSRVNSLKRSKLEKCYEILFDRLVGSEIRDEDKRDCRVGDFEDDSPEFLKAYCDSKNSFVLGAF